MNQTNGVDILRCPHCGEPLVGETLTYGPFRFVVADMRTWCTLDGNPIHFTERESVILLALAKAAGRIVPRSMLYDMLYYSTENGPEPKILDVYMCKIRKKLKTLGIEIDTSWGRGYTLVIP